MNKFLILFDLDDTLLANDMNSFLPSYLKSLSKKLEEKIPPEKMVSTLLAATQKMIAKTYPAGTLEQTFDDDFFNPLGIPRETLQPLIDQFYAEEYPRLHVLTQPRDDSVELVQSLLQLGCQIAIATNPLFPQTATYQRLEWANLSQNVYQFSLVSTYETFHFSKPHLAYYAEILAQTGWTHSNVVMVGNDWQDDILPAAKLGLPTFWISEEERIFPEHFHPASSQGSLKQILPWVQSLLNTPFPEPSYTTIPALMAILKSTPASLETITRGILPETWLKNEKDSDFNLGEIAYHLYEVDAEINLPRIKKLIEQENPFIPGADSDSWLMQRKPAEYDGPAAIHKLLSTRTEIIQLLETIDPVQWQRKARHAIFGPITLQEMAGFICTHDRVHVRSIFETINQAALKI